MPDSRDTIPAADFSELGGLAEDLRHSGGDLAAGVETMADTAEHEARMLRAALVRYRARRSRDGRAL